MILAFIIIGILAVSLLYITWLARCNEETIRQQNRELAALKKKLAAEKPVRQRQEQRYSDLKREYIRLQESTEKECLRLKQELGIKQQIIDKIAEQQKRDAV